MQLTTDGVRIEQQDFSIEEEVNAIRATSQRIGGVATFLGCARDFSDAGTVSAIHFEQYAAMAMTAMHALRQQALTQFDIIDVRIIHRITKIMAGEQIVLIVVAAEHRAEAFDACRWVIDTLKQEVPIWKKEINEAS